MRAFQALRPASCYPAAQLLQFRCHPAATLLTRCFQLSWLQSLQVPAIAETVLVKHNVFLHHHFVGCFGTSGPLSGPLVVPLVVP